MELQIETQRIVLSFDNIWYEDTYDKWVKRHRKCIAVNGDYVEKWVDMTIRKCDVNIFSTDVTLACSGYASVYVLFYLLFTYCLMYFTVTYVTYCYGVFLFSIPIIYQTTAKDLKPTEHTSYII